MESIKSRSVLQFYRLGLCSIGIIVSFFNDCLQKWERIQETITGDVDKICLNLFSGFSIEENQI